MQGYVPGPDGAFAQSRECYAELEEWLASDAAGLQHGELEEQLDVRGRELLRRLYQDRLDLTAAREERRHDVSGEDGVPRTRAEKDRTRPLMTKFGQVTVSRIAYRVPGRPNVHPLDAELNLPEEKHSHGMRKLAAIESARGSTGAAGAAVTRATGVTIGKRQLEELARRCAAHVDAFYMFRVISPVPDDWALVLTFDGKGIVMLPGALRPATAKAAAAAEGKLATRLSPGEKNGRKRMAELACVYDAVPVPRTPGDIISTPAQKKKKKKAQASEEEGEGQAAGAAGEGQVADRLGHRRHPRRHRRRLRRGRTPRPAAQARTGRPHRRQQHPDRGRDRRGRPPRRHGHDRHRLHPRPRVPVEGRLVLLRQGRARRRRMGRRPGPQDPARESSPGRGRDPPSRHHLRVLAR